MTLERDSNVMRLSTFIKGSLKKRDSLSLERDSLSLERDSLSLLNVTLSLSLERDSLS